VADFYEAAAKLSTNPKAVSNWTMTELLRLLAETERSIADCRVTPAALAELVKLVDDKTLNSNTAKEVFATLFEQGGDPAAIVRERGLAQVSDTAALEALVDRALAENPRSVEDYRKGKTAAAKHLMGHVMKASRGKANPQLVTAMLGKKLAAGA
jgi:aspartyl-tRNA(Asn)/glutamyl-tRNA(Gln) amidotransferase subunit B